MVRCAITDGSASRFMNATQTSRLQNQVRQWSQAGIDLIQLREKHLDAGALLTLAEAAIRTLREARSPAKLLINSRPDVAIAARADGVHLTASPDALTPQQVRLLFAHAGLPVPIVSVSCHTADDLALAREQNADLVLFGPVFEKQVHGEPIAPGVGLEALHRACRVAHPVPVLALGGVTPEHAAECMAAGAAGIAGIRTFL